MRTTDALEHEPFDALSLYEIEREIRLALEQCINDEGELVADVDARLDGLAIARDKKLLSYACVTKSIKHAAETMQAIERRLRERRQRFEARREWLRGKIADAMNDGEKIKDQRASVSCKASSTWNVTDEELIPKRFWKTKKVVLRERDDDAISLAIETGETVPGIATSTKKGVIIR